MNTLVIAETDSEYTEALKRSLKKSQDFKIVGIASDGVQALNIVKKNRPDILLMDLLLPVMDGLSILNELRKLSSPPLTICMSDFYSSVCIEAARNNGASYFVCKPVALSAILFILMEHAKQLHSDAFRKGDCIEHHADDETYRKAHGILSSLGFSLKHLGSGYLADAVIIAGKHPLMLRNLSSELYKEIAARRKTTPCSVERAVRCAIAAADTDGRLSEAMKTTPTNKRCIHYILNRLKSEEKDNGGYCNQTGNMLR